MELKKENVNGPQKNAFGTSLLIWLALFVTLGWSLCMFYVAQVLEDFLAGWPVFEETAVCTTYVLAAYFMAEFIYGVLLKWVNRQYFPFMLTYGTVFAVFILAGIASFAFFMQQVGFFWFEDFLSWRCVPFILGAVSFGRFSLRLFKDL